MFAQIRKVSGAVTGIGFARAARYTRCGLSQTVKPLTVRWATFWIASQFSLPELVQGGCGFPQDLTLMRCSIVMCAVPSDLSGSIGLDGQCMDVSLHQAAQGRVNQAVAADRGVA